MQNFTIAVSVFERTNIKANKGIEDMNNIINPI